MFRDLRQVGIDEFTLDRCPRCEAFCAISVASMTTTDDVINCWSITKSIELARLEQFLNYAQAAARAEQFYTARDVLLEAAAYVSIEDPRLHLSLGHVALHFMTLTCVMKQKCFFGSSNSKTGSADSTLNHGGPITIFSLRTQDCRRLISEAKR